MDHGLADPFMADDQEKQLTKTYCAPRTRLELLNARVSRQSSQDGMQAATIVGTREGTPLSSA